ncbi:hypothetical protein CKL83_23860 [Bacillus anthracis]|uniref:Uncharacterized protein n=4 Tax=Bacillus cereus group TaxID=86661 RepID=A0A2B6C178_BACAN|nr:hypothetical protein BA_1824 [Bacillus anthracis str. Ames]AAT30936.1 hypothetical protein GBAA_1824 [Bacillus anthracis str. 'Ames Ancestor']APT25340.1 hypothetical protein BVB96_09460 [Bacillus anthracis]ARZ61998.1 hypothetical protein B7P25_09320 [Bacillus thuringiensis]EDR20282.1 hypothetical protein BAC_1837 [Bacillus anthracis str. A0488]EDR88682.1 hypothetical protein BAQ_1866 [Bacillus anthracis str. A0193]EDR94141.1 hypothetical protein BAH_1864 [Bacillus anthracis str. A0442]EDS
MLLKIRRLLFEMEEQQNMNKFKSYKFGDFVVL